MRTDVTGAFPAGFLWGAATGAHQIEGGNVNSDLWELEHAPDTAFTEPSGDACDSYHRWREDLDLLAGVGLNTYRFSLEWSRIEPEEGEISRAALDHYRRMVDGCRERGLSPVVTLLHFTIPRWMHRSGGWRDPRALDRFARFCEAALPVVAEGVDWVCTINEPNMAAMTDRTAKTSTSPAGARPAPDPALSEVLVGAHRRAVEVLRSVDGLLVGWTVANQDFQAEEGAEEATAAWAWPREDRFLAAAKGDDFVGVQAYTRVRVGPDGALPVPEGAEVTQTGWEYWPDALEEAIRHTWQVTGGTPIIVTENGIASGDDRRRIDYTRHALRGLKAALADGIDVRGYLHWSALDNFEWVFGFRPRFGLIAVDRTTFQRTLKPSARWLGAIATANRLPE
jgi:beta-glucosidase